MAIIRNENGMTSTAITAARQLPSSRNSATATRIAPSVRLRWTVATVAPTNSARFNTTLTWMPGGSVFATRSEERRVGKECVIRVDLGGRRIIKKKNKHTI